MYLTRRNIIAWIVILASAVCWGFGYRYLKFEKYIGEETTAASMATTVWTDETEDTIIPSTVEATVYPNTEPHPEETGTDPSGAEPTTSEVLVTENERIRNARGIKFLGYVLCIAAFAGAVVSVVALWQKVPLIGPDVIFLVLGLQRGYWFYVRSVLSGEAPMIDAVAVVVCGLLCARELYGWLRNRLSLKWCALQRLCNLSTLPQLRMLIYTTWICTAVAVFFVLNRDVQSLQMPIGNILFCILGLRCIWNYGMDLHHFQKQLANFREGNPVEVGTGSFSTDEQQLLQIRSEHEDAVKTAVTSERFKVELISNVSHDLRTPLTSILGYGELLQKETLTDTGKEQLFRLNQKAGYMRDLVDSLFELTKISSGVVESKREQIDLIRLLEQTIGLFDDQLAMAGLEVRRHYESDSAPVITDGARMHQVFANLLGNAIKYALTGTRIYLEVEQTEGVYRIRMVNTASYEMDFAPEEIMQRFVRGDKARSTRGSGLGLAIAQTYTESVGGSFTVAVDGDQFGAIVTLPKN